MNIAIFGATGPSGRALVATALKQGHQVTALVRPGSHLPIQDGNLRVVTGDALNASDVERAISGNEAVISVLGATKGNKRICSLGIKNIILAMKKYGVKRLIVQSVYGVKDTKKGLYAKFLWLVIRDLMADKEVMEDEIMASSLDWVIIRPGPLTKGSFTGQYRVGTNLKTALWPKVSRADVAEFLLRQLADNSYLRQTPSICY